MNTILACLPLTWAQVVVLRDADAFADYTTIATTIPSDCGDNTTAPGNWETDGCKRGHDAGRWRLDGSGKKLPPPADDCQTAWFTCPSIGLKAWSNPHVVMEPAEGATATGSLVVWLGGTNTKPADYLGIMTGASKAGHRVLGLSYLSQPFATSMSNRWCDPNPPGYFSTANECNQELHQQLLFGDEEVQVRFKGKSGGLWPVEKKDSVQELVLAVLQTEAWGSAFLADGKVNWDKIIISGHSQGASHGGYLSQVHGVRAVLFSGPQDSHASTSKWAGLAVPKSVKRRSLYHAYEECAYEAKESTRYCQEGTLPEVLQKMGFGPETTWDGQSVPENIQNVVSKAPVKEGCTSGRPYHTSTAKDDCAPAGAAAIWHAMFTDMEPAPAPAPTPGPDSFAASWRSSGLTWALLTATMLSRF